MQHESARKIVASIINTWQWARPSRYRGWRRSAQWLGNIAGLLVILASVVMPAISGFSSARAYALSPSVSHLVGQANKNIAKKLVYDAQSGAYIFNQKGMAGSQTVGPGKIPMKMLQAQTGGDKGKSNQLYSVKLPVNAASGITYYDNNLGVSFSVAPNFHTSAAKKVDNHVVYLGDNGVKAIYTAENNGLKEDYVLTKPITNELSFSYKLNLPKTLEAKMLPDGSGAVGIYSADPAAFANVSSSSDPGDAAALQKAQVNGKKTNLVFALPAPVIKQSGAKQGNSALASFSLKGDTLNVTASGLSRLSYPVSIDPSVVVSSASDFTTGNNEGNIAFNGGEVDRGNLTGGSLSGGWTLSAQESVYAGGAAATVYNGYLYYVGGSYSGYLNSVQYSQIGSNGVLGAWGDANQGRASFLTGREFLQTQAYNGYLYVMGGDNGSELGDTQYVQINPDGTLGSTWHTASNTFSGARDSFASAVYNGYMYIWGGNKGGGGVDSNTQFTKVNADGSLGSWTSTGSGLTGRYSFAGSVYNSRLYAWGGWEPSLGNYASDVQYASINADGTVGSWITSSNSFNTGRTDFGGTIYNGYMYVVAGVHSSILGDVQYAQVYANGDVGPWSTTSAVASYDGDPHLKDEAVVGYGGYIYAVGGSNSNGTSDIAQYAKIDPAGVTSSWAQSAALPQALSTASAVAYNGYIYELAGFQYPSVGSVYYAQISASGVIGSWSSTTSLPQELQDASAVAYNGYIYELAGDHNNPSTPESAVYYAQINSNGTLGNWYSTSSLPYADAGANTVAYNGYIYELGGATNTTSYASVYYAQINSNGTLGGWVSTNPMPGFSYRGGAVAYGGYVYQVGYGNSTTVDYAPINSDGTLGTWTATSSLPQTEAGSSAVVSNGYVYEIGGADSSVSYAAINANGSLGAWTTSTPLPQSISSASTVAYEGYIYEIGGNGSGGTLSTVYYAQINNGGSGTTGSWATNANALPQTRHLAMKAVYNGYIYEMGGFIDPNHATLENTVYYTQVNADGSVGAWATDTSSPLPHVMDGAGCVVNNGYIYLLAGDTDGGRTADTYYAKINADGSLGSWVHDTASPVPNALSEPEAAVYNGYVYVLGGDDINGTSQATTYYAPLNADGSIGTWNTTSSLPLARTSGTAVVNNGYIYEVAGNMNVSGDYEESDVYYASLNANGTIGTWAETTQLPQRLNFASAFVSNGYMYSVGGTFGANGDNNIATVYLAPINANGTVGNWSTTTNMPQALSSASTVTYNGYVYEIGGYNASNTTQSTVYYASLNSIARAGHYSKLVDLGTPNGVLSGISYSGNLPGGLASISYRIAGSDGVFGANQNALDISSSGGGAGSGTCGASSGGTKYVEVFVTLDDSRQALFPDSAGADANLTDLTVNYTVNSGHPPPNIRLRLGQTLQTGTLSPLDTCGV